MKCICCPSKHAINHFVISYLSLVNDDIIIVIICHYTQFTARIDAHTHTHTRSTGYRSFANHSELMCTHPNRFFVCSLLRQKFNANSIRKIDRHTFIARLHFIRIKYMLFATNCMAAVAALSMFPKLNRLKKHIQQTETGIVAVATRLVHIWS